MNTILKYSCFIAAVILLSACDDMELLSGKGKFYYSNPSANTIRFKLDGKDYDVLPEDKGVVYFLAGYTS